VQWWADHSGLGIPVTYEGTGKVGREGLFNCSYQWDLRCTYSNNLVIHFSDNETYKNKAGLPHPDLSRPGVPFVHNAAIFIGTEGWVAVAYEKVAAHPASLLTSEIGPGEIHLHASPQSPLPHAIRTSPGVRPHHQDWIASILSGKDPVSPMETAVKSDLISQLSDLAIRTGSMVRWDPVKQTITGNEEARRMMSQPMRKPWKLA
jgi:hypothetical protein